MLGVSFRGLVLQSVLLSVHILATSGWVWSILYMNNELFVVLNMFMLSEEYFSFHPISVFV